MTRDFTTNVNRGRLNERLIQGFSNGGSRPKKWVAGPSGLGREPLMGRVGRGKIIGSHQKNKRLYLHCICRKLYLHFNYSNISLNIPRNYPGHKLFYIRIGGLIQFIELFSNEWNSQINDNNYNLNYNLKLIELLFTLLLCGSPPTQKSQKWVAPRKAWEPLG